MLDTTYIMQGGEQIPNPEFEMTNELLCQYIDEFDKATEVVVANGELVMEFHYYYNQLEAFAEINPHFNYNKLERRYQDLLAPFFRSVN